jgi:hypothetical protein
MLHGMVFAVASLWLAKRHNNWHWKKKLVKRGADRRECKS